MKSPRMNAWLDRLPPPMLLLVSYLGMAGIGWLDFHTGYDVSMSLFYLGPIALYVWYLGLKGGALLAFLSAFGWFTAELIAGDQYSHNLIPLWNALIRLGVFLLFAWLLARLHESLERLHALATTDGLTGLLSRRAFEERLEHDLCLAQRQQKPLSLAFLDLDDFKYINDHYGHAEGDRVLQGIGHGLQQSVRKVDAVGRLGGDEFALIMPNTDGESARYMIAELRYRLVAQLTELNLDSGAGITFSIGIVTVAEGSGSAAAVLAQADALMYHAKREGKNASAIVEARGSDGDRLTLH